MNAIGVSGSGDKPTATLALALAVAAGIAVLAQLGRGVWFDLDAAGLSTLSHKPPTWDFTNLWAGGRLALTEPLGELFSPEAYRGHLRAMFGPGLGNSEWSYPPSMLLVGAPLSLLPLGLAYALWTAGGLAALACACRAAGLSWRLTIFATASPAAFLNVIFGQNGSWTAALLVGALTLSARRPMLAGLLVGLLTLKPHLGVLVPICLIAAGHWRAFGWSCFWSAVVALATTALFGVEAWRLFLTETRPLMQGVLEAPWWTAAYQMTAVSVFMFTRALGASLELAYGAQAATALAAAVVAWRMWRRPDADPLLRMAATAALTFLATPYGWSYDLVALSVAIVALAARGTAVPSLALGLAFFWPAVSALATFELGLPLSPLIVAVTAAVCVKAARAPRADGLAGGVPPKLAAARI